MKINVAIVTIDELFYIPVMLKNFFKKNPPDIKCVLVIIVPTKPKKFSTAEFILNKLNIFGTSQFLKISSLYLFRKFLSKVSYADYSVEKIAKKNNIPVIKTNSLKTQSFLDEIKKFSLDTIISIVSSRIFGKSILSIPKIACLNVHASKLPKYRDINPSFWVLLNREKQSAVSVHFVNEKIDDGDIIRQDVFDLEGVGSLHDVYLKVLNIAPATLVKSLIDLKENNLNLIKNDSSKATYYSFPTRGDGKKFRKLGFTFM